MLPSDSPGTGQSQWDLGEGAQGRALGSVGCPISPLPTTGSSATRSRGSPPHSRYTAGQRPRRSTPWTVCAQRMPTPPGWATRSIFQDRCLQPGGPPLALPSLPLVGARLGSGCLGGCLRGGGGRDCPEQVLGAQVEPVSPSLSCCRPGTGMKSCRQRGSCLGRTCLSGCCEKEPYSRCPWPLRPDRWPQALLPPTCSFSVNKTEAGVGCQGSSRAFCQPSASW